jgi:hypothetical protein
MFEYHPDTSLVDISAAKSIYVNYKKRSDPWYTVSASKHLFDLDIEFKSFNFSNLLT